MAVTLRELTDPDREAVLALRVAAEQERFVGGSVQNALADAAEYPQAKPWYRAVLSSARPASQPADPRQAPNPWLAGGVTEALVAALTGHDVTAESSR